MALFLYLYFMWIEMINDLGETFYLLERTTDSMNIDTNPYGINIESITLTDPFYNGST